MTRRLLLALALVGCHGVESRRATVRLDLAGLQHHAAQFALALTRLELRVGGAGEVPQVVALPADATSFELELDAGPSRRFEAEAFTGEGTAERTVYWGATTVDLAARTEIDLRIPVFPAGRVTGTVRVLDAELPSGFLPRFVARDPANGRPTEASAPLTQGAFSLPLPTGVYDIALAAEIAGVSYALPAPRLVTVRQGDLLDLGELLLVPPDAPRPPALRGGPAFGLGLASGLTPGTGATLRSPSYVLRLGGLSSSPPSELSSPSFLLRPAAQPLSRSSP